MLEKAESYDRGLKLLPEVAGLGLVCRPLKPYAFGLVSERWNMGFLYGVEVTSELDFLRCAARIASCGDKSELLKNMSDAVECCLPCCKKRDGVPLVIELPSG